MKFKKSTTALAIIIAGSVFYGAVPAHAKLKIDDMVVILRNKGDRNDHPQPPREPKHEERGPGPRGPEIGRGPGPERGPAPGRRGPGEFRRPEGPGERNRRGFDAPPPPPPPPPHGPHGRGRRG